EDQKQHLELTRTLAQRINNKFGDVLTVPETWEKQQEFSSREVSVRIRSLTNPNKKMSKSVDDPKGTIGLLDDPALAAKKIMSATTDSEENIRFDLASQPGVSNLLQIGAILSEVNVYEYVKKWHGQKQYGPLKTEVAGLVEAFLINFKKKYDQTDIESVEHLLKLNEAKARSIAKDRLRAVQAAIGIRR
ncbi:tryptophan--tRNA ligase, partial [Candidatus Saccharibacteria bacterium]|nr:tryptophan--tRNA ligase [Candidatus Saccharibacteria bacterium]